MAIPENIEQLANDIRTKIYGREVREALASGIEAAGSIANDADVRSQETETKQTSLEKKYDEQIANMSLENPNVAEVVDARVSGYDGQSYTTIGKRLDSVDAQLARTSNEIVEARGGETVLKNRLDKVDQKYQDVTTQLAEIQNLPIVKNGRIVMPHAFPKVPFNIYKKGDGTYYHDATAYNQYDWSDAVEVFVTCDAVSGVRDGRNAKNPITINQFLTNVTDGMYAGSTKFIISILDNVCASGDVFLLNNQNIDVLVRSRSINGFTWWSRFKRPNASGEISSWIADSGVYKTTQSTAHEVIDIVNLVDTDEFGDMPKPYTKVGSLAECQTTKGTFYQNGNTADVWCNPHEGHDIAHNVALVSTKTCRIEITTPNVIMFENIGFAAGSTVFYPDHLDSNLYFFSCKFFRNFNDAFAVSKKYKCFVLDCVASYASKDCFNYHSDTKDSLAVEVNSFGYGAGMYKFPNGNQTTHSNNGSTAHDGMNMLRVGGKYWDCEGAIVADVNNCYSVSIGCSTGGMLESNTGEKAGFYFYDGGTNRPMPVEKYVIDCAVSGKNIEYGIKGTSLTYEVGTKGLRVFDGGVQSVETEDIA